MLIFTIALAKLFSTPLAGVALVTLVLTYHEPGAPLYVWLALLVGFALLKYLPDGKFKTAVKFYQGVTMICLISIVVPYTCEWPRAPGGLGVFNPHAGVSNCNAGLGPLAIFLACGDFKMGVATIYVANSLVPVAAQNKENG